MFVGREECELQNKKSGNVCRPVRFHDRRNNNNNRIQTTAVRTRITVVTIVRATGSGIERKVLGNV